MAARARARAFCEAYGLRLPVIMARGDTLLDTNTPQNLDTDMTITCNKPQTSMAIYCKI